MPGLPRVAELIDGQRFPLHHRDLAAYVALLEPARRSMAEQGWCRLAGLLTDDAVVRLADEADRIAPLGHRRTTAGSSTTVAGDVLAPASVLRLFAEWDDLTRFVADVAAEPTLFRSADPLGATTVDVFVDGDELGWTTEPADLIAVVVLRVADAGGVLGVGRPGVEMEVATAPGDLVVIDPRRLRRRVSAVHGRRPRLDVVIAYSRTAGARLTDGVRLERFGRLSAERRRGH